MTISKMLSKTKYRGTNRLYKRKVKPPKQPVNATQTFSLKSIEEVLADKQLDFPLDHTDA